MIADCQLPISDWLFAEQTNWQSAIGNQEAHATSGNLIASQ
jgi:hypothetical protein